MNDMLAEIKKFHETHTEEEILAIWKSLEKYDNVGPNCEEFISNNLT